MLPDYIKPELFWSKVAFTDCCWNWTASTVSGYGQFGTGRPKRNHLAHRLAYMALVGPIPAGMELDHLCYRPICVNPAHLEPVTGEENIRRMLERGVSWCARQAQKTHCEHGHEFTPENTRITKKGHRWCRACNRGYAAQRRAALTPEERERVREYMRLYHLHRKAIHS
jgi:hypothetical protein